jgi:CRP-like cAMP-binding protein
VIERFKQLGAEPVGGTPAELATFIASETVKWREVVKASYFTGHTDPRTTTIEAMTRITAVEIKAQALRAATDAVQTAFNKAFIRVLVHRLGDTNLRLAKQ